MAVANANEKIKLWIAKIKKIKNIEIIIAVIAVAIIIAIYSGFNSNSKNVKASTKEPSSSITDQLEERLASLLSEINGAGEVKVMITFKSTPEKVTANSTNKNNNSSGISSSGTSTETVSPIIINKNGTSEPIVLKELMPEITGVLVVAKGASNMKVKLELMRAVQTILNVNANNIEVFAMK